MACCLISTSLNLPFIFDRTANRSEIRRAFALWAAETPLTFREVNSNPDIEIDFNVGAHGDGSPFDGPSGVLAHAFFPELGTTHFDDREQWTTNSTTRSGIDLFIVAAHEFGHALGLDHSNVRDALMFPTYLGYIPDFKLNTDDIRGIRSIYGGPPTPRTTRAPTIPTTRPTTRATTRPTRRPTTLRPRPTVPTTVPFQCRRTFGAAFEDDNGDLMMIRGIFLYRIPVYDPRTGSAVVSRASNMFQRVMSFPDAIFQVPGSTYVIRRRRVQQFSRPDGTLLGRRDRVADTWNGLGGLPRGARITAAVAITQNEVLLFGRFRGQGYVWEYDVFNKDIIQSSMTLMQEAFPGIPPIVDMALSRDPIEIIFVAGQEYFRYDTESQEVAGPFAFAPAFVGGPCGSEEI
ncbi:Hatching enzyme [Mizuhopecten yessoensis]|uniref:Hatching enzyme n=1 Tax=Mizuhopecten yessoensis TaxID=6573 RepID=A0A210R6H3_MIZYE|nr:Hatching enzyme [Mizuhopecten yessoensis]